MFSILDTLDQIKENYGFLRAKKTGIILFLLSLCSHLTFIKSALHTVVSNFICFCFFSDDGTVFVWGSGSEGQLGLGEDETDVSVPRQLDFDQTVVHISCGYYHTALVTGNFCASKEEATHEKFPKKYAIRSESIFLKYAALTIMVNVG